MRAVSLLVFAAASLTAVAVGACAGLAGLPGYSAGDDSFEQDVYVPPGPDASNTGDDEASTSDEGSTSETREASGDDEAGDDTVADGHTGDTHPVAEAGADAGGRASDAADEPDVYVCEPGTCDGCCTASGCSGGQSVATCGVGGVACRDCTSQGACSSDGKCVAPVKDASPPPMCVATNCKQCAVAPIQGPCCKLDNTCGCQFSIFDPCM
jgi:hypothetical protein